MKKAVKSSQDAFMNGWLTTGLAALSGKGGRLIVVHAGHRQTDFVEGAADFFRARKGNAADNHSEMNGEYFERWFSGQLLATIPPSSILVTNNVCTIVSLWKKPLHRQRGKPTFRHGSPGKEFHGLLTW